MKLNKTTDYMNLNYRTEILAIDPEFGGGYLASIPQLGELAFRGYGETADEALSELEQVKRHLFTKYLSGGTPIPLPEETENKDFSGKILLRMPKDLHRNLAEIARSNGSTLNTYLIYLLTRRGVLECIRDDISDLRGKIWQLNTTFSRATQKNSAYQPNANEWSKTG
ncbi:MAG: hypothetical protein AUJ47_11815 [Candidatus Marinimicrobia bacterium CG1_02_48_14]|nr:MAG: hypothetical protein AUJ47_11815 [Candidatus Marinimicrobia bacterium CG1_02_48_14]